MVIVVFVVLLLAFIAVVRLCSKFKLVKCCDSDVESLDEEEDDDDTDDGDTETGGKRRIRHGDKKEREDEEGEEEEENRGQNLQDVAAQYDDEDDQEVHITGGISLWKWKLMITSSTNWRSPCYDLHRVRMIT